MRRLLSAAVLVAVLAAPAAAAGDINWTRIREVSRKGPFSADLRGKVTLRVPTGYRFVTEDKLADFHTVMADTPCGDEAGVLLPEEGGWVAVVLFPKDDPLKDLDKAHLDTPTAKATLLKWNEAQLAGYAGKRQSAGLPAVKITGWTHNPAYDADKKAFTMGVRVAEEGGGGKRDEVYFKTLLYGPAGDVVCLQTMCAISNWDKPLDETKKMVEEFAFPQAGSTEIDSSDTLVHYAKIGGAGLFGVVAVFMLARFTSASKQPRPAGPARPPARRFGTPR